MSRANVRAEDMAGAQEGVLIIYKVNFSFKVFAIYAEKGQLCGLLKEGRF